MRNVLRLSLLFLVCGLALLSWSCLGEAAEQDQVITAAGRFVDNGDGTVTDTKRGVMWQKGDNGKEVTFEDAQRYCRTLQLGGYDGWRLPRADERDTAVVVALMMPMHSREAYARFDLYWSYDSMVMLPFNYQPAHGAVVSGTYFARKGDKAFVRAIRHLGPAKAGRD